MPAKSRTRMVSFRLTTEEYERFRQLCLARGLRNVSELVRAAVNHMLNEPAALLHPTGPSFESRLAHLEDRLHSLALTVETLHHPDPAPPPQPLRQAAAR